MTDLATLTDDQPCGQVLSKAACRAMSRSARRLAKLERRVGDGKMSIAWEMNAQRWARLAKERPNERHITD